jgi:hypothetical protein
MMATASVVVAAPSVMAAAAVMVATAPVMMGAAAVIVATAVVMAAAVVVSAPMIVSASVVAVAGVAPPIPSVASAPAEAGAIGIPAPIPARALPAVVVPTIVAAVEDELSLFERQELIGQGQDECAVRYRRLSRASERRCGAYRQRQAKSKSSRHGSDSSLLPNAGRRLDIRMLGNSA